MKIPKIQDGGKGGRDLEEEELHIAHSRLLLFHHLVRPCSCLLLVLVFLTPCHLPLLPTILFPMPAPFLPCVVV